MSRQQIVSLMLFGIFVIGGLTALIKYEMRPQTRVSGKVTRFWRVDFPSTDDGLDFTRCFVELEREGQRVTYSCDPGYYGQLGVGLTVRLHLKGNHAEYVRVLSNARDQS